MVNIENMRDIINVAAEKYGDSIAFKYKISKDEIEEKTYKNLKEDTEAFSNYLNKLNFLGKHIAVIGDTSYNWVVAYFGVVNSGGVIVPIDAQLPAGDICELINRADVEMVIYDSGRSTVAELIRKKCVNVKHILSMEVDFNEILEKNKGFFSTEIDREKLCAILFTSGTTGKSKGVMLNHRNLVDNAISADMRIAPGTVSMTLLPIHHAFCFTMDILKGIHLGLCICINDSIMRVIKNMKLFKPEIICLVPMIIETMYNKLSDATGIIPKKLIAKAVFGGNLKYIYSGGAYLNQSLIDEFEKYGITVIQGYGMTECSPVISTNYPWDNKKNSVGKLLPNCIAKTVDEEIWVKGSSVMMGYYKMPKETEETLEDGFLKTGDLGYVDEDNFIFITGRKKNLIILSNGENISPEGIENELSKYRLVKEVLVYAEGDFIKAAIYPDFDYANKKKIKDIKALIEKYIEVYNEDLPVYKRVQKLEIREEELKKTTSKKIIRSYVTT